MYKKLQHLFLSLIIVLFLIAGFFVNFGSVRSSFIKAGSWKEFVAISHAQMMDKSWNKNGWIDGNGLLMRLMGRRLSNKTLKYRGGLLEDAIHPAVEVEETASSLARWNSFVKSWGGRYMFVLAPCKLDRALEMLPHGCDPKHHNKYESVDKLHRLLSLEDVPMLDLSHGLADNLDGVCRNFYRTDHHWRYEAAFAKFPEVARKIAALAGRALPEDLPQLNIENWQAISYKNGFLGSQGRRVGAGFAGKDDFTYLVPKFDTDIDFVFWSKKVIHRRGPFHESIVDSSRTARYIDSYKRSRYSVYFGAGHYPMSIKSRLAPCKMRLMVIKDSFALPMLGYLSTVFSDVEVIDPRKYDGSIAEFVRDFRPDVMMTFVNMKALSNRQFFDFDHVDLSPGIAVSHVRIGTVSKSVSTSNYSHTAAKCNDVVLDEFKVGK